MKRTIRKAAVLGAGVMGAKIAAHLANAGVETYLMDIVPKELTPDEQAKGLSLQSRQVRDRVARRGLESAKTAQPSAFFLPELVDLITIGNVEDDLGKLAEADWIIEAVVENRQIKLELLRKVDAHRHLGAIVSSNTSGLPIKALAENLSEDFRKHWLGTHFFNPPRYMKLVEVIPTDETQPDVVRFISDFCDHVLGKGVVIAKDSPNFIVNRIGMFAAMNTIKAMVEEGLTIEEVDRMTGPALGRPKSAMFRTADLAGLDTFIYVAQNLYENVPNDEQRDIFKVPDLMKRMFERGWLGDKSGQGFYKKVKGKGGKGGSEILALDYKTMDYRPQIKPEFPSLDAAKNIEDIRERVRTLIYGKDRVGSFLWKIIGDTLVYAANRAPEIAEDILGIDNAMKWGLNWELGVFETWDAIGVTASVKRWQAEGKRIPPLVQKLLDSGKRSFYETKNGKKYFFDFKTAEYKEIKEKPGIVILSSLKERNNVIKSNADASLIDLGDGVACLEFHSKMNAIGADTIAMMNEAVTEVGENFEGLVIGNQGENFCVGANIFVLLLEAQQGHWDRIDLAIREFQNANMRLKYSEKPIVAAPFGLTLGGGCEITMHAGHVRAAAESYIGLVEVGVGLIPAGGGTKELLLRHLDLAPKGEDVDLFPHVRRAFETIAMAKVSTSALEAKKLGYLRENNRISMNKDRLIEDAKQTVLALARMGHRPPSLRHDIPVLGESALAALKLGIHIMKRAGYISDYDAHMGAKLAYVVTGGDLSSPTRVTEQYLLDLEREAFLSLVGETKTQERIMHMLQTGKPLRN